MGAVDDAIHGLWAAISARDWDAVATFLTDDCIYIDMPTGPTLAARGPGDIVKRLRIGLDPLAGYQNHEGRLVCDGDLAMYEHSETWTWKTGETVLLRFVTVHELREEDGIAKIAVWKDYWDMAGLTNFAPPTWMDDLMASDMSWIFDATDLV